LLKARDGTPAPRSNLKELPTGFGYPADCSLGIRLCERMDKRWRDLIIPRYGLEQIPVFLSRDDSRKSGIPPENWKFWPPIREKCQEIWNSRQKIWNWS